ncbi:ABC transporter ATP-binding protein [bacterium 1XD42-54]|nr:ABC transporter ATP-binding protein [bacterium 1XD42-54]
MIFAVKDGCFGYDQRMILNNINIQADRGEILAVLGPNGAGKTTLLKCMMGLLPWAKGKSLLDGTDMQRLSRKALWKRMAYVPQAKGCPMAYTAEEMVVLGRSVHLSVIAQPTKADYAKAHQAMELVNIGHLQKKLCSRMSGGELQMVLIARALAAQPDILILDEPESNLDFKNQLIILETMKRLASEEKLCCIFNTHYPDHALKIADRALLLDKNGTSIFGRTEEIINRENMRQAFEVDVCISNLKNEEGEFLSVVPLSLV